MEIYNPTQATIMLSAYKLGITINGGNTIERNFTFASTATVAAGGTYTVCHSSISPSFAPQCDLLQTFTTHNGDDAYSLVYSGMGPDVVIDRWVKSRIASSLFMHGSQGGVGFAGGAPNGNTDLYIPMSCVTLNLHAQPTELCGCSGAHGLFPVTLQVWVARGGPWAWVHGLWGRFLDRRQHAGSETFCGLWQHKLDAVEWDQPSELRVDHPAAERLLQRRDPHMCPPVRLALHQRGHGACCVNPPLTRSMSMLLLVVPPRTGIARVALGDFP